MYYQILETNYIFKRSVNEKYLEFGETVIKTAEENINMILYIVEEKECL